MPMTRREIIKRHLEFAGPDRIGLNFTDGRADDFCEVWLDPSPVWRERRWTEGRQEFYTDEWGNTWFRMAGMGRGGEIYRPALTEWDQLKEYRLPDMAAPERYATARRAFAAEKERYRLGGLPGFPFAICRYLRKMENYFRDLLLESDQRGRAARPRDGAARGGDRPIRAGRGGRRFSSARTGARRSGCWSARPCGARFSSRCSGASAPPPISAACTCSCTRAGTCATSSATWPRSA